MIDDSDRAILLRLARESIAAHVNGGRPPSPRPAPVLDRVGGAFVTLHARGELRGCIGHLDAAERLATVIPRCAVAASSSDPRFPPVSAAELLVISVEISLLGPLEPVGVADDIEVGRHGVVVERGSRRGLLLPQVAHERRWDRTTLLAETCRKAGLQPDAWRQGAVIWRFEAEVFGERRITAQDTTDTTEKN